MNKDEYTYNCGKPSNWAKMIVFGLTGGEGACSACAAGSTEQSRGLIYVPYRWSDDGGGHMTASISWSPVSPG